MEQGELPPPAWLRAPAAELAQAADPAQMAAEKFRLEGLSGERQVKAFDKKTAGAANGTGRENLIENQGQIMKMSLPDDWQEARLAGDKNTLRRERIFHPKDKSRQSEAGVKAVKHERQAHPADSKSADLVILESGRSVDESDERALRQVLQAPPHKLTKVELKQIERALGDLADPESFKLEKAESRDLNGRRVLDVQGVWLFNKNRYHGLVVDSSQQIYLMSPPAAFARLNQSFETACRTIKWR